MTEGSGLLEKACRAVAALNLPACIKDSELRYLVVNAAYARLMGRPLRRSKATPAFPSRLISVMRSGRTGSAVHSFLRRTR
ncbi:two component sensor kinase/response regulator hybrid [Bradyrhizobium lupini HPC(L)]|uniref:Two component sensor kinase/response regulator hybrid n=1 Tax=Bradyrhizobium lupini HPC(L) TaxID=1229491 RepID=A0ABN0HIV9_RHILU|nr:two component sensor kinase/response regulator hybrid [Bradyrhizobium lupini HPC(L)]